MSTYDDYINKKPVIGAVATPRGWEVPLAGTNPADGLNEVLVAIGGLDTTLDLLQPLVPIILESFEDPFTGSPSIPLTWIDPAISSIDNSGWTRVTNNVTDATYSAQYSKSGLSSGKYAGMLRKGGFDLSQGHTKLQLDYTIVSRSGSWIGDTNLDLRVGSESQTTTVAAITTAINESGTLIGDLTSPTLLSAGYDLSDAWIQIDGPQALSSGAITYRIDSLRLIP